MMQLRDTEQQRLVTGREYKVRLVSAIADDDRGQWQRAIAASSEQWSEIHHGWKGFGRETDSKKDSLPYINLDMASTTNSVLPGSGARISWNEWE